MKIKFKKQYPDAMLPTRGSDGAAGLDLYAYINGKHKKIDINPHSSFTFGSGLCIEIPEDHVGLLFARSGLGIKQQLAPPNCVSVIDSDYRGEMKLPLQNGGKRTQTVLHGERIGQLLIIPCVNVEVEEANELSETERGARGLGSTGKTLEDLFD